MTSVNPLSKRKIWAGRALTWLVTLALLASAVAKIAGAPTMVDGLTHAGIPHGALLPIAALELICLVLYLFPRTAVLGTFLLTGYFGGATVTHIIGRENFFPPLLVGLWILGGAYFRIPQLQSLLPLMNREERQEAYNRVRNAQPSATQS
jgi:hypothetical protein